MIYEIQTAFSRNFVLESSSSSKSAFFTVTAQDTNQRIGSHLDYAAAIAIRDAFLALYPIQALPAPRARRRRAPKAKKPVKLTPQAELILDYLRKHGNISASEAATVFKVRALPRRIADIKASGVSIRSEFKKDSTGQRYVRYHLGA